MVIASHCLGVVALSGLVVIVLGIFVLGLLDDKMKIFANGFVLIVLHTDVEVFLGMHENLFISLFIFEAKLVEPIAPFAAVGFQHRLGHLTWQRIRGHFFAVVNSPCDNWLVRIAF